MEKVISEYFNDFGKVFSKNLPQIVEGVIISGSASVVDRGFSNDRSSRLCVDNSFNFVFSPNENLNLKIDGNNLNLKTFSVRNAKFKASCRSLG